MPEEPSKAAFGNTRRVGKRSTISVESVHYSVPHEFVERGSGPGFHGDELIVPAMVAGNAIEVAYHLRSTPGRLRISDEHYPGAVRGERTPRATNHGPPR
ncbi:hypothetical protein [Streptomyces sp. B3I7]|uniref:hypothetical protein n=1 Tax=Streptomyces sp. B3I7 TaxID=3042269 RepID=UPI00358F6B4B